MKKLIFLLGIWVPAFSLATSEAMLIKHIRDDDEKSLQSILKDLHISAADSLFSVIIHVERNGIKESVRPVELAVAEGKVKALKVFLRYLSDNPSIGIPVLYKNPIGLSLLHIAIKENQRESARALLEFASQDGGPEILLEASQDGVLPAIVYAAQRGQKEVVAKILEVAALKYPRLVIPRKANALQYAVYSGHIDVVRVLLDSRFGSYLMSGAATKLDLSALGEDLKREMWLTLVEYEPVLAFRAPEGLRDIGQCEAAFYLRNSKLLDDCDRLNMSSNHTLLMAMLSHKEDPEEQEYLDLIAARSPFVYYFGGALLKAYAWLFGTPLSPPKK